MLKLEQRPQASKFWTYGSPVLALLITVLIGVGLFVILGKDPVRGLQAFFWEPVKSGYALGELAVKATPLLLIALGLAVCFRSNVWNIGAEGQFVIGAVAAAGMALLADKNTGPWIVPAILVAGMLGGMAWAGIVAVLKVYRGVSEVITTLMLNAIGPIIVTHFLNRYGQQTGYEIQTKPLTGSNTVTGWAPYGQDNGQIWTLGLLAVLVGVGFWLLLNRTRLGFDLRATGLSASAAAASGVGAKKMVIFAMLLSGGVAGLVWIPEFFGGAHTYSSATFTANLGFTGLAVALLGRNRAGGMVLGALLFSWLTCQSDALQIDTDIAPQIVEITQGICVLAVVVAYELVQRYRARAEQKAVAAAVPEAVAA